MISYATGASNATGQSGSVMSFFPLILIAVFFYFFMIKPQKKRQQQMQDMKSSIKVGDKVVLYSGLIATVVSVNEDVLVLQSEPDSTNLTFKNWAVREVINQNDEIEDDDEDMEEEEKSDEE